jgi:hypothetical protein
VIVDPEPNSIARGIVKAGSLDIPNHEELIKLQSELLNSFSWPRMANDILQEWKLVN